MKNEIKKILEFWFGELRENEVPSKERQKMWWGKNEYIDSLIKQQFEPDVIKAASGELDSWLETPEGMLSVIILLDQFPRNIYRDTPKAFSFDSMSLPISRTGIDKSFDRKLHPVMRIFFYIPFMHSEDLEMQNRSVDLFVRLEKESENNEEIRKVVSNSKDFAIRHMEIIRRFGRFPHRNEILGRKSTPEEREFLKQPGSSF